MEAGKRRKKKLVSCWKDAAWSDCPGRSTVNWQGNSAAENRPTKTFELRTFADRSRFRSLFGRSELDTFAGGPATIQKQNAMLTSLTCEVGPFFQPEQIEDLVLNHFFLLIIFKLMVQSSLRVVLWVRVTIGIHTVCTPNEQDHELDEF